MTLLPDDLTTCSLEEVVRSQAENRAWSRELRLKSTALVNSRLAKAITLEDYAANRKLVQEEAAECSRRAAVLANELNGRAMRPTARELMAAREA
jgi:hypothetical protein